MDKVNSQKMIIILLSIAVVILLVLWRLTPGPGIVTLPPDNQKQIDSLRDIIRQQEEYVASIENSAEDLRVRIIYKTKEIKSEKADYIKLDSNGRIDHFRSWVRDSTTD